ncbi:MAG: hypothetical protein CMJ49_01055 [Planctomycetaceae bacterium]|nr:hypothetical protein [Planctomycetaceae bacterium]
MRQLIPVGWLAAAAVCVTLAAGASSAHADGRIIMDFDNDYVVGGDTVGERSYRSHRLYGLPGQRFTDLDGDQVDGTPIDPNDPNETAYIGNDDSHYILNFSLADPLNPDDRNTIPGSGGLGYDTTLPGAVFYGGIEANFYNVNARGPFNGNHWSQATVQQEPQAGGSGPGNYFSDLTFFSYWKEANPLNFPGDTSDDTNDWRAVFVWKQEDFFNGADDRRVEFDPNSYIKVRNIRDWNVENARPVVKNGDQFYVADQNWDPLPSPFATLETVFSPLDLNWAEYNPTTTDFGFDQDTATYLDPDLGEVIFDNITSVGMYFDRDSADTNTPHAMKFANFEVFANVVTGNGDVNNDGVVDVADLGLVGGQWGTSGNLPFNADINDDDLVDVADLGVVGFQWGTGSPGALLSGGGVAVPAPVTAVSGLTLLGGMLLRRRRRC